MEFCKLCDEEVKVQRNCDGDLVCQCGWVVSCGMFPEASGVEAPSAGPRSQYESHTAIAGGSARGGSKLQEMQKRISTRTQCRMSDDTRRQMRQRNLEVLRLPETVLQTAEEIYEIVAEEEKPRGANRLALLPMAMYLACKAQAKVSVFVDHA